MHHKCLISLGDEQQLQAKALHLRETSLTLVSHVFLEPNFSGHHLSSYRFPLWPRESACTSILSRPNLSVAGDLQTQSFRFHQQKQHTDDCLLGLQTRYHVCLDG